MSKIICFLYNNKNKNNNLLYFLKLFFIFQNIIRFNKMRYL